MSPDAVSPLMLGFHLELIIFIYSDPLTAKKSLISALWARILSFAIKIPVPVFLCVENYGDFWLPLGDLAIGELRLA